MNRAIFKFIGVGAFVFATTMFLIGCAASTPPTAGTTQPTASGAVTRAAAVGQLAPEFSLPQTDGATVSLAALDGNPAVLVFWTAWCPACKEEAPKINRLAEEFGPRGVKVIGINIGESDARVAEGIKDFGIKYAVARDKDTSVSKSYKVVGTPTIVILDKKGVVLYVGNELPSDYSARLTETLGG